MDILGRAKQVRDEQGDGFAYGRPPGGSDHELVRVGPGTPAGELLRRYWFPIAASAELKDLPQKVRLLGEELILFRVKSGSAGLVHPRCIHRGTSLFYGRIEEAGIRCCYHGWLFDTEGRCLDMPCEPHGGANLPAFRQPWYPVEERYGLIFAYLGPAAGKPKLPRYDLLENLEDGAYETFVDAHHIISSDPQPDYNWLQKAENTMDPFHVYILHNNISREQFHPFFTERPKVKWQYTEAGMRCIAERRVDGKVIHRVNDLVFPALGVIGDPLCHEFDRSVVFNWFVPRDDHNMIDIALIRAKPAVIAKIRSGDYSRQLFPKLWPDMTTEDHQREPSDYEAQAGQGRITLHSEEHLVSSDRGVAMFRRQLRKAIRDVASGKAVPNRRLDDEATIVIGAGNYLVRETASKAPIDA